MTYNDRKYNAVISSLVKIFQDEIHGVSKTLIERHLNSALYCPINGITMQTGLAMTGAMKEEIQMHYTIEFTPINETKEIHTHYKRLMNRLKG